jgi:hypothetical protein
MIGQDRNRGYEEAVKDYIDRYRCLLRDVAGIVGVDPDALLESQNLVIGGVRIGFIHYGGLDPDHMTCCLQLDDIEGEPIVDAYCVMLEQNVNLPGAYGTFGLLPDTGRPVLLVRLGLDVELTSLKLLAVVEQLVLRHRESFEQPLSTNPVSQQRAHR